MINPHAEKLAGLRPEFKPVAQLLLERMIDLGASEPWAPVVAYGRRTPGQQERLYEIGREHGASRVTDGRIVTEWRRVGRVVTNARAWESPHCVGIAVDIALVTDDRGAWLEDSHPAWLVLGREAEALGLEWGGRWKFRDAAHCQAPHWRDLAAVEIEQIRRAATGEYP